MKPAKTAVTKEAEPKNSLLGRLKNEFKIEFVVTVFCFLLALGLTTKVVVAITAACLRFALPDMFTAALVLRHDPSRRHGIAVALLFLAMGMCRSASVAFFAVLGIAAFSMLFKVVPGPVFLASLSTCILVVYVFLLLIFPSTFIAFLIAKRSKIRLSFAHELTRLRRSGGDIDELDEQNSIRLIAIGSAISLSMVICSSVFIYALRPNVQAGPEILAIIFATFTAPFVWIWLFTSSVSRE